MKMRKLFAGIAAAATLLGGMALGAASAQADDAAEATFTFTAETAAQLNNANLKAYKIGDYVQYGSGENVAYGVVTNSKNKTAVDSALKAAGVDTTDSEVDHLAAALNAGTLDVSPARPWASPEKTRKFANALESEGKLTAETSFTLGKPVRATNGSADAKYTATATLPAGIYVFIDSAVATGSVTKAIPMIVASGTVDTEKKALTDPIQGANTVNMKNTNNPEKTKEVNKTSAAIGDTLIYTLTGVVASPAPAEFKFTDRPGTGLTIKADTFKFYDGNAEILANEAATDFTVPGSDVTGGENAFFDVIVKNPSKYAGKTIKVTFKAVVNDDASVTDGVVNKLDNYGGTEVEAKTKFVGFDFTKVDPDGKGIKNVTFQVEDGGTVLHFVKQDDGSYKKAASVNNPSATTDVKTDANGKLAFTGLDANKTYTVTETERASDVYLDIKPSFTVSFEEGVAVLSRTATSDPWGLVNTTAKTVKNVKSITQLPLTGAAGTTLFTVVALLVAGAGVTVAVKSRQRTH